MNQNLWECIGEELVELTGTLNGGADVMQEMLNKNALGTNIKRLSSLVESLCFNDKEFIEKKEELLTSATSSKKCTARYATRIEELKKAMKHYEEVHSNLCEYLAKLNGHKEL